MLRNILISLFIISSVVSNELCSAPDAQLSCGQCIKAHEDCAWCIDPHTPIKERCQHKSFFTNETCLAHLVYSPQKAHVKVQQDLPLEAKHHDGKTIVRLQPQAVSVRLMPGHSATLNFKYLHQIDPARKTSDLETMELQTSDIKDTPLSIKFFIKCDGEEKETKTCQVRNNQIVEIRVEIHVSSCSTTGDVTLSLGVRGQRTIAGLYVTTVCGCECEKHPEINSRLCHQHGHLVCGQCVCNSTRGGDKCECPLSTFGVSSSKMLEDQCRFNSSSSVCSSSGRCDCGQCRCNKNTVSGKFCQCDNESCPKSTEGQLCSGNGVCDCGKCKCENGWERDDCSCSTENNNCQENGELCSNNGRCECNRCVCNAGRSGATCGIIEKIEPAAETPDVQQPTEKSDDDMEKSDEDLEKMIDDSAKQTTVSSASTNMFYFITVMVIFIFM